jgi:hypothetical protein
MRLKCPSASTAYGAVDKSTHFIADINPDITVETVDIGPPYTLHNIFGGFEAGLQKVQSSPEYTTLAERGERPKIVVIVDALSSNPGLLMPWERVVEFCKSQENVWTLVDAAHAIGQIVEINLNKTQPDFFISVGPTLVIWSTEVKPLWINRTATNGYTQNEDVQFFMSH